MLARIKSILRAEGYSIFKRPFELNIVGLRSRKTHSGSFDDEIHVFYKTDKGKWHYHIFPATTDPGTFWLQNPMAQKGTAILAEGQYSNTYGIDRHRGKYYALCQLYRPVTVIRDYDRNAVLDFFNGNTETGFFGINVHRATAQGTTKEVDRFSAGCQVFANATDFQSFMRLCELHRQLYGNRFTYTLVDFRAKRRRFRRRLVYGSALAVFSFFTFKLWNDGRNF